MFFISLVHLFFIISYSRSVCQTYSGFQSMAASTDRSAQKIRPGHLTVSGALKRSSFLLRQDPCKSRSYAAGGARYLQRRPYTPDTRGVCFQGPSRALWYLISRCGASHGTKHRPGSEISQNACGGCCTSAHRLHGWMRFSASYRCIAQ